MFKDMVAFLDSAWKARGFIVPCLIGPVGIGKTAAVLQHAENVGAGKVVTIIASQILPNEVSGITMPVPETKAMEIFDHYRLSSLEDGDILFFDELLEADQLVLSACLTLIESRQLMSGNKLPDVQIIAATNPTIVPTILKENIRQRFVFRKFDFDKEEVRQHIKQRTGIDVQTLVNVIQTTGNDYNILSPRSLTKMAEWMAMAENLEEGKAIAAQIDSIWNMGIGTNLLEAKFADPMAQVQATVRRTIAQLGIDNIEVLEAVDQEFTPSTIGEVMELLQSLPEWGEIAAKLESTTIEEVDKEVTF